MINAKECRKCGKIKPLNEFGKDIKNSDGHRAVCKVCHNDIRRMKYNQRDIPPSSTSV